MFKTELIHLYQILLKSPSLSNANNSVLKVSFITKSKFWYFCIWENKVANSFILELKWKPQESWNLVNITSSVQHSIWFLIQSVDTHSLLIINIWKILGKDP